MSIPVSFLVKVNPGVISPGGSGQDILGLTLTENHTVPIDTVASFPTSSAVGDYFGLSSKEAAIASNYFAGFTNSSIKPSAMLFAQYPASAVSGYMRGGSLEAMSLTQLQALSGSLTVSVDGIAETAGSINLSTATSFSNAAEIIGQDLGIEGIQVASVTGSIGGVMAACTSVGTVLTVGSVTSGTLQATDVISATDGTNSLQAGTTIINQLTGTPGGMGTYTISLPATPSNLTSTAVTSLSTVLHVATVVSGALAPTNVISASGITDGTYITAFLSATGGVGTYSISNAHTTIVESIIGHAPAVTYNTTLDAFVIKSATTGIASTVSFATGSLSGALNLTSANGAVISPGAAAATPATFMDEIVQITTNWATFMSIFDPDNGSGNTQKLAFAAWNSLQDDSYAYIAWDTDASPTITVPATTSLGYLVKLNGYSGVSVNYDPTEGTLAAFICGSAASIDFDETNGRITFAYKSQAGLVPGVTDETTASNLIANGYNFYGEFASSNAQFLNYQNGSVSGEFSWLDSYINQIWLNSRFQLSMMNYLQNVKSVPYNTAGDTAIEAACSDTIQAGLNFGAYAGGVTLSADQISQVNTAANANVAGTLQTRGWYFQVQPSSPATRKARTSPPLKFWYTDQGSVQELDLDSVALQ